MQKLKRVIKDNSGASIMFVLGIALLLLAISTSALVAASASDGARIAKQTRNQLNLYSDSVQKIIMSSLMSKDDKGKNVLAITDSDMPKTLNGQILRAIYNDIYNDVDPLIPATATSYATKLSIDIKDIALTLDGDDSFTCKVGILGEPYIIYNSPSSLMVNAGFDIKTEVGYRGNTLTSIASYNYSGGLLLKATSTGIVTIDEPGEWRFVSYEKIDS